jgi:LuxR family maltose regulon positive regulatory protein
MAAASGRDQASAALRHLDVAIAAIGGRPPRLLAAAARAARARLLATAGDDEAALAALGPGDRPRSAVETVVLGRLQLAQGDPMAAVRTLAPLLASEPGGGALAPSLAIEANLVAAVANRELADHAAAVGALRRALELAAPEGYRRAFVEGGAPVRQLLADHLHWDNTHHLLVGALLERLRSAEPAGPAALVVPLSEREQVVLRYLSSRLSAGEIADELYVSLNTVKTHIKSIYRKLDTNRRWDAVKRARQLQLL